MNELWSIEYLVLNSNTCNNFIEYKQMVNIKKELLVFDSNNWNHSTMLKERNTCVQKIVITHLKIKLQIIF